MSELESNIFDDVENGNFVEFSDKVSSVLAQKVQDHPFIKSKKDEYVKNSRIKDAFAEIETYLDKDIAEE